MEKLQALIEIPRDCRERYAWNEVKRAWVVSEALDVVCPENYGHIPKTIGEDGEPLDIVVLTDRPLLVGKPFVCRPLGILLRKDGDHKLLAVPLNERRWKTPDDIPNWRRIRLEAFLTIASPLTGYGDEEKALEVLTEARLRYLQKHGLD